MSYSDKLKDPRWQKKRLFILERAGWACQCCKDTKSTLHIHHLVYSKGAPWDAPDDTLECLCDGCHDFREHFNTFWQGRSRISTAFCSGFFGLFASAFDGTTDVGVGSGSVGELRDRMLKWHEANKKKDDASEQCGRGADCP